jgi:hypothetical protein
VQFNLKVLDDRPSQNGVDGNVGTKHNAKNRQFSTGHYPVRQVVADNSGELPVGCGVKVGGVLDSANELNCFKRVCVIELLEGMDKVRVGHDHPLVEEEVARTDGGTSVIETHKGHSGVKGMPQVNSNHGHQVVDADWERRKTGAGGGRLLEDLNKYITKSL